MQCDLEHWLLEGFHPLFSQRSTETYLEPCPTSTMELFAKIGNIHTLAKTTIFIV